MAVVCCLGGRPERRGVRTSHRSLEGCWWSGTAEKGSGETVLQIEKGRGETVDQNDVVGGDVVPQAVLGRVVGCYPT